MSVGNLPILLLLPLPYQTYGIENPQIAVWGFSLLLCMNLLHLLAYWHFSI